MGLREQDEGPLKCRGRVSVAAEHGALSVGLSEEMT